MHILVKYPTRQRPELFVKNIKEYIQLAEDLENMTFLISYDEDDKTMVDGIAIKKVMDFVNYHSARGINIIFEKGSSKNKIDACNRDINKRVDIIEWDIVLLISDDMHVQQYNWDEIIRQDMKEHFPDTDGSLWYPDGHQPRINTLSCMGKKYYDRFGYIYHPSYKSFYCDEEYTIIAMRDKKMVKLNTMIAKHNHPAETKEKEDDLYKANNKYWNEDQQNFKQRKLNNFPL
jgi:hypothetical protein